MDPFKILQDLNLNIGGRIGDDGYAYVNVNQVFGMIKGFFDTPLSKAIENMEKDQLPLGDRYLNAMHYVQNARDPKEVEGAKAYLDKLGDLIDQQGGINFPVGLPLTPSNRYNPVGWSPFQHGGAVFNPADGDARMRMTSGQAAGEFIVALDKLDAARGVQPDPQLRSRISAAGIQIEEPAGLKPASYNAPANSPAAPEADAKPTIKEYDFKPDISLNTPAEFDLVTRYAPGSDTPLANSMSLADKVNAVINAPVLLHGQATDVAGGGVPKHDRLVALYDVMTDYVTNGTEPATQEARAALAAQTFSDALGDPRTANNYAHLIQTAHNAGNAPAVKAAADKFDLTLGAGLKPRLDAAVSGTIAAAEKPFLDLEFKQVKLDAEFGKKPLAGKLDDLLGAGLVYDGDKELNPKERAEMLLETLKTHVEKAGLSADGKPLEGEALVKAQEAALKEVAGALSGLDAKEQQNLKVLLQEDGLSLEGLDEKTRSLLQQAAISDNGKANVNGKDFGFMDLILAFIAMILPEGSELRQSIEAKMGIEKPAAAATTEPAAAAEAVVAPITRDEELSAVVNDGSYLAFLKEKGEGVTAAYKTEGNIKIVGIESLLEGTKDGKLDEKELAQINTPDKIAALLAANGFVAPQQAMAVADAGAPGADVASQTVGAKPVPAAGQSVGG